MNTDIIHPLLDNVILEPIYSSIKDVESILNFAQVSKNTNNFYESLTNEFWQTSHLNNPENRMRLTKIYVNWLIPSLEAEQESHVAIFENNLPPLGIFSCFKDEPKQLIKSHIEEKYPERINSYVEKISKTYSFFQMMMLLGSYTSLSQDSLNNEAIYKPLLQIILNVEKEAYGVNAHIILNIPQQS